MRVSLPRPANPPTLTPEQVRLILDACASWDPAAREWSGSVRDRLLWALLAESGMRLGEALALQHRDWHTGLGDTPFVEVVPREAHPHGLRVKNGGYRRIYISDELDRLCGEYLWRATLVPRTIPRSIRPRAWSRTISATNSFGSVNITSGCLLIGCSSS